MNKEDKLKIEIIKSNIEIEKTSLDRYVKAIVRSAFIDCCTGGAYWNKQFHDLLKHGMDAIDESKKPQKEKDKLRLSWFPLFFDGENEVEKWESNLKYHKSLTNWAKHNLTSLDDKTKEEIVRDCITQQELWNSQFDRNSKLYKALEAKK